MFVKAARSFILSRSIKKRNVLKGPISFKLRDVKSALLLIDLDVVNYSEIDTLERLFQDHKVDLSIIGYSRDGKKLHKSVHQLYKKHFKFGLYLDKEEKGKIMYMSEFDIVLVFNPRDNYYIHYILANVKAKLRIGNRKTNLSFYDIMINAKVDGDCSNFVSQTFQLLKNLSHGEGDK